MNDDSLMLVDAHIHTAGISFCSQVPADRLVRLCADDGVDAIVLTNHCKSAFVEIPYRDWVKRYVEEYETTRALGAQIGLKVFFGIEVTPDCMRRNDFTIYGLTKEDLLDSPALYELSLEDLSRYAHEHNALFYHAHPFRKTEPVDASFLDGTEINCHPLYRTCAEVAVRAFADEHGLRLSCGSDYHGDTYKPHCGMYVPRSIDTTADFVEYIRENRRPPLLVAPDPLPDQDVSI